MDNTMINNLSLTPDDLLEIVVALDDASAKNYDSGNKAQSDKLRDLKWKVFALMVKAEKEAA